MPTRHSRLFDYWGLLFALVYRDITQRYRRSLLGPLWAVLQPLILMVLFNMLHNFINISSDGIPYVIFSYTALVPWAFFTNAVMFCSPAILQNANIIKKTPLSREIFLLSAVIIAMFDFLMSFIILVGIMFWFGVKFSWFILWALPLLLITSVLAFAVGMGISALGVFKRDFVYAAPFLLQFWMFVTPVIYPLSSVTPRWRAFYIINPMVGIIEGFRSVLVKATAPPMDLLIWSITVTTCILFITRPVFRKLSQYFADML